MGSKKKQTVGYKYFAYGHFVLCHGPIDSITKISFQDKEAYTNETSSNQSIYIDKPNLFGGDEQSGGIQGNVELLFGRADQQKSNVLKRICGDLISAWRGVTSVVFDNVYIGTSPTFPESKWRVKRIHTLQDGQQQWYDEKAAIQQLSSYITDNENITTTIHAITPSGNSTQEVSTHSETGSFGYDFDSFGASKTIINLKYQLNQNRVITILGGIYGVVQQPTLSVNKLKIISESWDNLSSGFTFTHQIEIPSGDSSESIELDYIFDQSLGGISIKSVALDFDINDVVNSDFDINPAHIIRECLTNSLWGKGANAGLIDDISFEACADTLYTEGMGMSMVWSDSTSIKEFIDNVLEHINGELYVDRITNLWTLQLIRNDYKVSDLQHLTESHYKSLTFERKTLAECVNQVTVTYYDRERAKDSTVTVQDVARIAQQGGVVAQKVEYKGFTNSGLASRVALRDLKTLSSELSSIEFDVPESVAENWHKAYVFKLSNSRYGLSEAVFRVTEIKFGDGVDNTVSVKAIEDSFSSPMQAVVEYMPPVKNDIAAKDATAIAFEVPYIELVEQYGQDEIDAKLEKNPDLSFVGLAAVRPNNFHINASLYSNAGAGYAEESTLDFCPSATLKAAIGYIDTIFEVENVAEFELLKINHRIQLDDELMAFVSFDTTTHILTVKRGVADTVPAKHIANARIYGWDNYSGLDSTEYLSGEAVAMKALTLTGSDILDLSAAAAHSITCNARAIRPYPPANVKFNDDYYPESLIVTNDILLTWVDRNRIQQTGGEILGFYDAGVTKEMGVSYSYELISENVVLDSGSNLTVNTVTILHSVLIANKAHTLRLWSEHDGYTSHQIFEHAFFVEAASLILTATATESEISGNTVTTGNITVNVDETLTANMLYNGSSITGKAQAGATITINIEE